MSATPAPHDNPAASRFEIDVDGELAYAEYQVDGDTITFVHTFVPETLRGHGLASRLVVAGLGAARERHLKVVPQCTVFAAYIKSHPETADLLAPS